MDGIAIANEESKKSIEPVSPEVKRESSKASIEEEGGPVEDEASKESSKETSEEDNYMELYVAKELKDKFEPLESSLKERMEEIEKLVERVGGLDKQVKHIDEHYDGVSRAILSKQGVMLKDIDEYHILKEYARIAEKEAILKQELK